MTISLQAEMQLLAAKITALAATQEAALITTPIDSDQQDQAGTRLVAVASELEKLCNLMQIAGEVWRSGQTAPGTLINTTDWQPGRKSGEISVGTINDVYSRVSLDGEPAGKGRPPVLSMTVALTSPGVGDETDGTDIPTIVDLRHGQVFDGQDRQGNPCTWFITSEGTAKLTASFVRY